MMDDDRSEREEDARLNLAQPSLKPSVTLGPQWSFAIHDDPKRLCFVMARYKFAAKMACKDRRVLELGSSEGFGGVILAEFAKSYTGIDYDREAIAAARANWTDPKFTFIQDDFLEKKYGDFDAVVSHDVIEHIQPEYENLYFDTVCRNLVPDGRCVIGTPNKTAAAYASATSNAGHVNLYDHNRLRASMLRYFRNVFMFGMNDEIVHTGFPSMAHFLVAVGCSLRAGVGS